SSLHASISCRPVQSAVGCSVTLKCTSRRRSWLSTTSTNRTPKGPHGELLPKREVLQRQLSVRANSGSECTKEDPKPSDHDWPNSLIRSKSARESRRTTF